MRRASAIIFLVFVLYAFIAVFFVISAYAATAEFEAIKELEETQVAKTENMPEVVIRPKVEYNAENLRDPFVEISVTPGVPGTGKSVGNKENPPPALIVQGLIWGGPFPQSIINNKVVKVGDVVEGASVVSINKSGVVILFEGRQYNLSPPASAAGTQGGQK